MADHSKIEWTDATWNPLRDCSRVSDGCRHCYAEGVAARFSGPGLPYEDLIHPTTRGWNGQVRLVPELLRQPWDWVKPRRIFVNSMSDLFHESVPFEFIAAVFWIMSVTTRHTYQVLTKRPARALQFFRWLLEQQEMGFYDLNDPKAAWWLATAISEVGSEQPGVKELSWRPATAKHGGYDNCGPGWPYDNVWLGVSVENQAAADERIPLLLQCPAAVRWLSCEPLLGPIDLEHSCELAAVDAGATWHTSNNPMRLARAVRYGDASRLDWVVVGGESGKGARPMHPAWARSLRDQCASAGVPFFFKQWGEWAPRETWANVGLMVAIHPDGTEVPDDVVPQDVAGQRFEQVGKKHAGRLLDGCEHDAYPEVRHG